MARPLSASDDDILLAARKVMTKRGPDGFSIAEVATEVGLSRAAIILRFKSTHALKVASLQKMVELFGASLETLPKTPSGDNLLRLAAFIGSYMRSRESSVRFFANYYSSNAHDHELFDLERQRGMVLHEAISRVMPECALELQSAVLAFRAHLTGTIMAWLAYDDPDSRSYLVMRTGEWLKLAGISFSDQVVEELSAPQAKSPARARSKIQPATTRRAGKGRLKSVDVD